MIKVLLTGVHTDNRYDGYTNFEPIYGSSTLIVERAGDGASVGGRAGGEAHVDVVKILIDPSHIAVGAELNELLKKEGVLPEQIDYVFITHHHLDHSSNMGAFPNAKIFIGDGFVARKSPSYMVYKDFGLLNLPKNFSIIPTPGHTLESNSYLYVENGVRYICAGDALREDVIREGAPTVMADRNLYMQSLKKIFQIADVIIPGHGRVIEGSLKNELAALIEKM